MILLIIYWIVGYWAAGEVLYKNKIIIEFQPGTFFIRRAVAGLFLGWILIPIAIIKILLHI